MTRLFLFLFRYFRTHRVVFYATLVVSSLVFLWFATRIHFQENILDLLPKTDKSKESAVAFGNIRVKDKVFVSLLRDGEKDPQAQAAAMDDFLSLLSERDKDGLVGNVLAGFDSDDLMNIVYYGLDALPCHIGPDFYPLLDSLGKEEVIDALVSGDLAPPVTELGAYTLLDGHLFSPDSTLALAFLSPSFPGIDTQAGRKLERLLSGTVRAFEETHPGCEVLYHGATIEGTFNSQRIISDLFWTVGISLLLICLLISLCFKTKSTLLMLVSPVAYGTVFALACVYWIQGEISLIVMGIGAIVLGVALSYCLHVLTHHKFVNDVESVIREQTRPVILGCLTTIGAFAGLLLTSSSLLRDFGLFASFAMIGTTFFALAFLPQFFDEGEQDRNETAFKIIGKINSYPLDRNKPLVFLMAVVTIICIYLSGRVAFDSDLSNIGYREPKVVRSEQVFNAHTAGSDFSQYFAAWSRDRDSAILYSRQLTLALDSLRAAGVIKGYSGADRILIPETVQQENIDRWKAYWTPARTEAMTALLRTECDKHGWEVPGFDIPETFRTLAEGEYEPHDICAEGVLPEALLGNFIEENEDGWMVFSNVRFDRADFKNVCDEVTRCNHVVVLDPFYYTGDMVEIIHNDFQTVLLISSLFVLLVLLLSFRSLTVTLIAFLPMALSWYIVQGAMAIFGLKFNLVNIMISTFIFGIGVDYSIFVMEGLINRARSGSHRLLVCHKSAIFLSAMTLLIVVSSLLFARHPAISSIGISTLIGMTSTILITYALQPLLFRLAMKSPWLRRHALHEK